MDVVKRLRNALGNRPSGHATGGGPAWPTPTPTTSSRSNASETRRDACLEQMDSHLTQYLLKNKTGCRRRFPREEWIAALHPERDGHGGRRDEARCAFLQGPVRP